MALAVYFKQIAREDTSCLSYIVGCYTSGECMVVDPQEAIGPYLKAAEAEELQVVQVMDTHIHADHVSGSRLLAEAAGAILRLHEAAAVKFDFEPLREGEILRIGNQRLKVLHTPGHTPESVSLLVEDHTRGPEPWFILTGDTLFVGDVGRPDLGRWGNPFDLFRSVQRLMALEDHLEVYPAHYAGSACGRFMSPKPSSTVGFERRFNRAVVGDEGGFIRFVQGNQPPAPAQFEAIRRRNLGEE
jgi:glyoxylase-like metal-dependent hydrolase (beta-lactamase superfamily II)